MIMSKFFYGKYFLLGILLSSALSFTSCSDSDDNGDGGDGGETVKSKGEFLIAVKGADGEYILQTDNVDTDTDIDIKTNTMELEMTEYLWSFNKGVAVGLVYQQGSAGIGYGFALNADKTLKQLAKFQISTRFTSYGFFGDYLVTSVGGQTPADAPGRVDGATFMLRNTNTFATEKEKTILTQELTTNGELVTFSGVVDLGNNQFLTAMIQSEYSETSEANGGNSTGKINYPDSVRVAVVDKDMNVVRTFGDNRISYSSGRFRSQYYSQMGKTSDGAVYVFSGAYDAEGSETKLHAGALRLNTTADGFDKDYYFDIQALTGGYKFKRLWYISGHRFLLEIYNDTKPTLASMAAQYGIVDMEVKTFDWITNLPSKGTVKYSGIPMIYNNKIYLPLTEYSKNAALYIVDASETKATKGLSVTGATEIRAIGHLSIN